jgi:hypothetical protein
MILFTFTITNRIDSLSTITTSTNSTTTNITVFNDTYANYYDDIFDLSNSS